MPESRNGDDQAPMNAGIEINGPAVPGLAEVLTDEACAFVAMLERRFGGERRRLLEARAAFQARIDAGENPAFRPDTKAIREGDWTIAGTPTDLTDRRVEITGPVDRKMIINALNCGASCFMADFEDAASPTWEAMIAGQVNLRDASRRTIAMTDPNSGKSYALGDETATLIVRPRGWHLEEAHLVVDGRPASASLFDFGLYFFHNAAGTARQRHGSLLLSAQAGALRRSGALECRLRRGPGGVGASRRHDQGHGADRDHHRSLRDGRDPARAERPHRRPQLRPLGLHLQRHQDLPEPSRLGAAGPRASSP